MMLLMMHQPDPHQPWRLDRCNPFYHNSCSILEANTVLSPTFLYALGGLITVARVAHVLQLSFPDKIPIQARMFGFLTTCLFFVVAGALCFLVGLQVGHCIPTPGCNWIWACKGGWSCGHMHLMTVGHPAVSLQCSCAAQETPYIGSNFLGNHRSWLGYAQDKAYQASDAAQTGYQAAKDKAAEF